MKLEVGMYVRTDEGIRKIIEDYDEGYELDKSLHYLYPEGHDLYKDDLEELDIKASHNIIDLIEVGDYVNGEKITRVIPQDICGDEVLDYQHIFVNDKEIFKHEINSIVTKEQMERMKYEVK